jgi:hypothetical protein
VGIRGSHAGESFIPLPLRGAAALFTTMAFQSQQYNQDFTKCPKCASHAFYVLETRSNKDYTRRRRHCKECKHRETFYEISQEQYRKFQKESKELEELTTKLRKLLLGTDSDEDVKDRCKTCMYVSHGKCALGFPEAFTPDAYDCSAYVQKT